MDNKVIALIEFSSRTTWYGRFRAGILMDSYLAGHSDSEYVIRSLLAAREDYFKMFPGDIGDLYEVQADLDFHELVNFMKDPKKYRLRSRLAQRFAA